MPALDKFGENREIAHILGIYQERRRWSGCCLSVDTVQSTRCQAGTNPGLGFKTTGQYWPSLRFEECLRGLGALSRHALTSLGGRPPVHIKNVFE